MHIICNMKDYFKFHHFRENQSIEVLSKTYGVPVCMIFKANNIKSYNEIKDKKIIKIPYPCYCEREHIDNISVDINNECASCENDFMFDYIVKDNESLFEIADKFCVPFNLLIRLNDIFRPESIKQGTKLKIPLFGFDIIIHKVCPGERLLDIAKKYNLSIQDIKNLNFIKKSEDIYPSMKLIIPKKASAN